MIKFITYFLLLVAGAWLTKDQDMLAQIGVLFIYTAGWIAGGIKE